MNLKILNLILNSKDMSSGRCSEPLLSQHLFRTHILPPPTHVCTHTCTHTCTCTHTHINTHTNVHPQKCTHTHTYTHTHMSVTHGHTHTHVCHARTHTHVSVTHVHTHTHVCHARTHTHTCLSGQGVKGVVSRVWLSRVSHMWRSHVTQARNLLPPSQRWLSCPGLKGNPLRHSAARPSVLYVWHDACMLSNIDIRAYMLCVCVCVCVYAWVYILIHPRVYCNAHTRIL